MDRRRNAVYLISAVSLLAGLFTGRSFFFTLTYAFVGLLALAFIWAWSGANWLKIHRETRARRAQVGQHLEEVFALRNTGLLPKLWLEVYDFSDLPGHEASHVVSNLWPRSAASWTVRTRCVQRGVFQLGPLRIVAGDPFGLFQFERVIPATAPLVVYPPTFDLAGFALPAGILPGGDALRRRTHHITTNASGVRDYLPGDSFNRIHWRSTARKERLIVKEFELDPLADIWVMMDADRTVHVGERQPAYSFSGESLAIPPTTEEYAVAVSASLVNDFIKGGRTVGLVVHGEHREIIQADRGPRQLTKILETLAFTRVTGTSSFGHLVSLEGSHLGQGTTVVLVTPSTREDWVLGAQALLQRGLRVIAVLIDAESFGGRPGARLTAARLGALNIPTYIVAEGDDLRAALSYPAL
jgi:uncharacterized protein (DUF58 family)